MEPPPRWIKIKGFQRRRRRLTGGGAAFANVGQRAVDGFLGLVSVFPQQHKADLVPQLWTDHALLDVVLDDVIYEDASRMEEMRYKIKKEDTN